MDACLADVCISTSAAPTFLPAHYFETVDHHTGASCSFNVIDGGIVANNPVCFNCISGWWLLLNLCIYLFFNVQFPLVHLALSFVY
jgi:patatin-like phospholipase/acyl hydrolase